MFLTKNIAKPRAGTECWRKGVCYSSPTAITLLVTSESTLKTSSYGAFPFLPLTCSVNGDTGIICIDIER